jgi:amino acid adenylation domain-containing protein
MWNLLIQSGWKGSKQLQVISGGEVMSEGLIKQLLNLSARVWNMYGPTETTVFSTAIEITSPEQINLIGKPVANTQTYILDGKLEPQPIGIPGELCIAGEGVALGYLNNEDLTKQKFIENPYGKGKLYLTGDIARWNSDGNIEFFGRKDNQLKIRGYRIEPGEIEQCLLTSGLVNQVFITVDEEKSLLAYYISDTKPETLREYLQGKLPYYMIPLYFIQLESIPLTSNGKIDRKALPAPHIQSRNYKPALTLTEKAVARIWEEVLNKPVSMDDNFFDIGGHSLKALQVISRIFKELSVKLAFRDLFTYPVLSRLSALISTAIRETYLPIPRVSEQETYPLSNSQKRLWVLSQIEAQSVAYNISTLYKLKGALDITALATSVRQLIERHESMRTVFVEVDGEPRQRILPARQSGIELVFRDFRDTQGARAHAERIVQLPFDLEQGPLFRMELLQTAEEEYLLVCSIHHIISDEWSMQIMVKELIGMYNGEEQPASLPIQYRDYAVWQQEQAGSHRQFWLSKFSGELPVLELPADYSRPAMQQHRGSQVRYRFSIDQSSAFRQLLQQQRATQFMGVLTLVNILLFRYSGQSDLIIGTPVAGRQHPDLEDQIGYYLNTLPLRNEINGENNFIQVLEHIRQTTIEAFSHQAYPFDLLVEELDLNRDLSRSPLFDVMVVLQNANQDNDLSLNGIETELLGLEDTISKFDLSFYFEQNDLRIEYNTDLFSRERIEHMARHLEGLLDAILLQPAIAVSSLSYLSASEQDELLHTFNNTGIDWQLNHMDLVSCFEKQVAASPDQTAFISNGISMSYRELNEKANQLADCLRTTHQVNGNELIGLSTARNEHLLIGILGILKAGAAYVPLDPEYPVDRISYIIRDSKLRLVLTDQDVDSQAFHTQIVKINDIAGYATLNCGVPMPSDIAYVIYTSGSTGKPKGVMVQHHSVVNVLASVGYKLEITDNDRWVAITTCTFDMSVVELLLPLTTGCRLILAASNVPEELAMLINENDATILQATPGMWNLLIQSGWQGSKKLRIISGGEVMSEELAKQLLHLTGRVWNMYGPTETTVFSTAIEISSPEQTNLIGKPIANTQIYMLDDTLQLQPVGIPGELCIAGEGLAQGYLNKDSKEKFISNPYGKGKLYRTGDIARWNKDGIIEFFGRRDNQVKIRGYRIEPGEIEENLLASGEVNQVIVLPVSINSEKTLVAYYTSDAQPETLREYLQGKLPQYMVPAYFMQVDKLPLTSNGKIDRNALPVPHIQPRDYKPAVTSTEKAIARIWEEILNKQVSINDNFFNIGGHSLKAIQIISRIYKELQFKISFGTFMQNPTISALADLFTRTDSKSAIIMELGAIETGKPDLFLFSPLIGTPVIYKKLCDTLSTQYNCYGLQDAGFDDAEKVDKSLSDKVDLFTKHILEQTTEKKISLLGFSFGATVAFEVAKQLEQKGITISLIIIDRPVNKRRSLFNVRKNFVEQEDLNWFLDRIKTIDPGVSVNWNNNIRLMENYKQKGRVQGQMIAFKSKENLNKDFLTMEDWKEYSSGNFSHYYFKGDHYACLEMQDNIDRIYDILTQKDKIKAVNY